jgi:hypothetical protein
MTNFHIYFYDTKRRFLYCAPRRPGASRDFSKYCFFCLNLCVLFFQTATKFLGQTVLKLFGPEYWINGSVIYFSWSRGAVKKILRHQGRREPRKFANRC